MFFSEFHPAGTICVRDEISYTRTDSNDSLVSSFLLVRFFFSSKYFLYTYRLAHFYTHLNKIEHLHIQDIYKMSHEIALCLLLNTWYNNIYLSAACMDEMISRRSSLSECRAY